MGQRVRLSNGRRLVDDVIRIANRIPSAGISGDFDTGLVDRFRRLTRPKISWNVLYIKAYAAVAARTNALQQTYVNFPWPHLYQHDNVVCMMTVSREFEGEERLFFARFNNPQLLTLPELQERYDYLRTEPVRDIQQFRHQINFAKAPGFVRRFAWWLMFELWPKKRGSQVGTIGTSFSGYRGVFGNQHLGPLTTVLGIDPFPRKGISRLVLTFDHRVMDGIPATEVLNEIHYELTTTIRIELANLVGCDPESGEILVGADRKVS